MELHINNSISSIGLIIQNVSFHPGDPSEKVEEKLPIAESGSGPGSLKFITSLAAIIGISIGLILVLLAVVRTGSVLHPSYLGNRDRQEDLQQIRSPDDTATIQGKVCR